MFNTSKSRITNTIYKVEPTDKNYADLKTEDDQRDLKLDHASKLKESMSRNGSFTDVNPILVTNNGFIKEGQHLYNAAVSLNLAYHIIIVDKDWDGIIILNTNKRNWNGMDFAGHWARKGIQAYIDFVRLKEDYPFVTPGVLVAILNRDSCRKQETRIAFKDGLLPGYNVLYARQILDKIASLQELGKEPPLKPSTHKKQQFQQAMLQAFKNPKFSFVKFKRGLAKSRHKFNLLAKQEDMLKEIYKVEKKGTKE